MRFLARRNIITGLAALIFAAIIFAPMTYAQVYLKTKNWESDFSQHIHWAQQIGERGLSQMPPEMTALAGWHIVLLAFRAVLPFTLQASAFILSILYLQAFLLAILAWYLPLLRRDGWADWQVILLGLGTQLAAPISLLAVFDGQMYLGYLGINSYHSPTMYLLKPLALIQFLYAAACFEESRPPRWFLTLGAALVSLLAAWVKPVFALVLLPALAVFAALRLWRGLPSLAAGLVIPTVFFLAGQFLLTYRSGGSDGLVLAPLAIMSAYSKNLGMKFLLSSLFPLAVLFRHAESARRDIRLQLALATFLFGSAFSYLLAESGLRALDGNFIWCGEIALLIFFAAASLHHFSQPKAGRPLWLTLLWGLHVLFGILYYLRVLTSPHFF